MRAPCVLVCSGLLALAAVPGASSFSRAFPRRMTRTARFAGLVDKNGNPIGGGGDAGMPPMPQVDEEDKAFDQFLGELIFSPNPVQNDIADNLDRATPEFIAFLRRRAEESTDPDEKEGMASLADTVETVLTKIEERMAELEKEAEKEEAETVDVTPQAPKRPVKDTTDILQDMKKMQTGDASGIADDLSDEQLAAEKEAEAARRRDLTLGISGDALKSYESFLAELAEVEDEDMEVSVEANYEKCDIQLMSLCEAKAKSPDTPKEVAAKMQLVLDTILRLAERRMEEAGSTLKEILAQGTPQMMLNEIAKLARTGRVDEPLVLVIEANIKQATDAGATGPAQMLRALLDKAKTEMDRNVPSEQALLRQLLRTESREARYEILTEAFRPRKKLSLKEGEEDREEPNVTPPSFIDAAKALLLNFGNVDSVITDAALMTRMQQIADDAEAIATSFYGSSMTAKQQQDRMIKEGTVSVFTLEEAEKDLENSGKEVPWGNDAYDHMETAEQLGFERMHKEEIDAMKKDIGGI